MDPFVIFPLEVSERILNYLRGSDILSSSLVSPIWYEVIADSAKLMDKVRLRLNCFCKIQDVRLLALSTRKYQHIIIEEGDFLPCERCIENASEIIVNKKLRTVEIVRSEFATTKEAIKFLEKFEKTVEWLLLMEVRIHENIKDKNQTPLKFPKLKELHVTTIVSGIFFNEAFPHIETLERITIHGLESPEDGVQGIREMMKNSSKSLKVLNMDFRILSHLFNDTAMQETENIKLKINKFYFIFDGGFNFSANAYNVLDNLRTWGRDEENVKSWKFLGKYLNIKQVCRLNRYPEETMKDVSVFEFIICLFYYKNYSTRKIMYIISMILNSFLY